MKIIGSFFLSLLAMLSASAISVDSLIDKTVDNVCEFIENNLFSFNCSLKVKGFDFTIYSMEKYNIVIDSVDGKYDGKILFFNGQDFYITIGDGLILYDYGVDASDIMYAHAKNEKLIFSVITGYFYCDGDIVEPLKEKHTNVDYECGNPYSGQTREGAGCIENPDLYLKARYGDSWSLYSENTLTYKYTTQDVPKKMEGFLQREYQCYYSKNDIDEYFNEGNCCIVAPYTVARYILRKKYYYNNTAYANEAVYNPKSEETDYYNSKNIVTAGSGNYLVPESERKWCELYRRIRRTAYLECGKPEYLTIFESAGILEKVLKSYYITADAVEHISWGLYVDQYKNDIDNGKPLMWSTASGTYGSHTMAVAGYRIYSKEEGFWAFKYRSYKNFAEIRDGWTKGPCYFDFSAYTGYATLVSLDY